MKKFIAGVLALLFAAGCFAKDYKTGDACDYKFLYAGAFDTHTYIAGVIPDGETGFYIVEILTTIFPANGTSAVGAHSTVIRYRLKEGDTVHTWTWKGYGYRTTLVVKAIGDNHIELEEEKEEKKSPEIRIETSKTETPKGQAPTIKVSSDGVGVTGFEE